MFSKLSDIPFVLIWKQDLDTIHYQMLWIPQEKDPEFHKFYLWSYKSHELLIAIDLYKNHLV